MSFLCLVYLQIQRLLFVLLCSLLLKVPVQFEEFALSCYYGFSLDIKIVLFLFFVLVALSFASFLFTKMDGVASIIRRSFWTLFVVATLFLTFSSSVFFMEFHSRLDLRIFNGIDDGLIPVTKMLVASFYLITQVVVAIIAGYVYWAFVHPALTRIIGSHPFGKSGPTIYSVTRYFSILSIGVVLLYTFSFGAFEKRHEGAYQLSSKLMEAAIIPAPLAAYKAMHEYLEQEKSYASSRYSKSDVVGALSTLFPESDLSVIPLLDEYFVKTTKQSPVLVEKPRHVFVLFMERYDSWHLLKEYEALGVSTGLKQLMQKGIHFDNFLPGAMTTMSSLQVALTGLPNIGLKARHFSKRKFPGAIARNMSLLGYKTRFFYGGSLDWNGVGLVTESQGFDESLGFSGNILSYKHKNMWGVDDESLFDFVLKTVNASEPASFNLILSSTNHPPYDLPLEDFGVPVEKIESAIDGLEATNGSRETNSKRMAHLWYSDRSMASFVEKMQARFPNSLFVITGDHFSYSHIRSNPPLHERATVPLVLYGSEALTSVAYNKNQPGSHLDIAPTLMDIIAPKGFKYISYGNSLLDTSRPNYSYSANGVLLLENAAYKFDPISLIDNSDSGPDVSENPALLDPVTQLRALNTIIWWRMIQGNSL